MAQGIAYDKEEVMKVLEPFYKKGMSTTKACRYAGIEPSTVTRWLNDDPNLAIKVKAWQSELSLVARENIERRIRGKDIIVIDIYEGKQVIDRQAREVDATPDVGLSQWWLTRKEKDEAEFVERTENVQTTVSYEELLKMQEQNLAQANEIEAGQKPKKGLYDEVKPKGNTKS